MRICIGTALGSWRRIARLGTPYTVAFLLLTGSPVAAQDVSVATIRALVDTARHPWALRPDLSPLLTVVEGLYPTRRLSALWTDGDRPSPTARAAIDQLLAAPEHGLYPGDYDAALLAGLAAELGTLTPEDRARFDVLLTVDLVRFLDEVRYGRLRENPFSARPRQADRGLGTLVSAVLAGDSIVTPCEMAAAVPPAKLARKITLALVASRGAAGRSRTRFDAPAAQPGGPMT